MWDCIDYDTTFLIIFCLFDGVVPIYSKFSEGGLWAGLMLLSICIFWVKMLEIEGEWYFIYELMFDHDNFVKRGWVFW